MSAFPWENLITGVSAVAASLGSVWLKGHQDVGRETRQAQQAASAAQSDRRRDAYASLVATARLALRNFRQLRLAYAADELSEPDVEEAFRQTSTLAAEMNQATASAELLGSPDARMHAKAVYAKAKHVADYYQEHSLRLHEAQAAMGKSLPRSSLVSFDAAAIGQRCDALAEAIENFITAVRAELIESPAATA